MDERTQAPAASAEKEASKSGKHKKISIAPPEGEALARYTVRIKPLDVFWRQIYTHVVPIFLKSALKLTVWGIILRLLRAGLLFLKDIGASIDDRLNIPVPGWLFTVLLLFYAAWLIPQFVIPAIKARTEATAIAAAIPPEEYAFFTDGLIFSNSKDLIRIPWNKVRLVMTTPIGMILHAGGVTDTMIIPVRYFCHEYPKLKAGLRQALRIRFIVLKKLGRDHTPMYENPLEKVTIAAPEGEPIGEMEVALRMGDASDLHRLWLRQIAGRHNRGVFGFIFIFICSAALFMAAILLKEAALLPAGFILLAALFIYGVWLAVGGIFKGRSLLVNRSDYKKPVTYIFYPAGFLLVYDNGISYVMYEDLDLIFEDMEGLGFFFSRRKCLFVPGRYMHSVDGVRLSHFFKASLFNLDPERAYRKARPAGDEQESPKRRRLIDRYNPFQKKDKPEKKAAPKKKASPERRDGLGF